MKDTALLARKLLELKERSVSSGCSSALFLCSDPRLSEPLFHGILEERGVVHAYLELPYQFEVGRLSEIAFEPVDWLLVDSDLVSSRSS